MFAKDTLPRLPISFRIIQVSNLTYKALQEMGASLTLLPTTPPQQPHPNHLVTFSFSSPLLCY